MADPRPLLPPGVSEALAAGHAVQAGELLRAHAEHLARSEPGPALAWSEALLQTRDDRPELQPWIDWAAATVLHLCGEAGRAAPLARAAARMLRARHSPELADRVGLILLDLHAERLELRQARRLAGRLERRFEAAGDRRRLASTLANLANAEDASDRVVEAARLWRRALAVLDRDDPRALLIRGNLGNVAALEGRLEDALEAHRSIAETARCQGLEALAAQADINAAEVELALGEVDAALRRWHGAAEQAAEAGLPLLQATVQIELAAAELELGQIEQARRRLLAGMSRLEGLGLVLELARAWRLLAVADAAGAAPDPAIAGQARAVLARPGLAAQRDLLEIDLALLDPEVDPAAARAAARRLLRRGMRQRGLLGLAFSAMRLAEQGEHRQALRLAREVLGRRRLSPWIRMTAHHAAAMCLGQGSGPAMRHARAAVRAAEQVRGRLRAAADRSAFLHARRQVYLDLIWRLVRRHRAADLRQCLDLLGALKAGWLVEELEQQVSEASSSTIARWQALRRRLAALIERAEGEDEPRVRRVGMQVNEEIRRLETELGDLETELHRSRPGLLGEGGCTAADLPRLLPDGHAFVELLLDTSDVLAALTWQGRLSVVRLDGAADEVRALAESVCFHRDAHTWMSSRHQAARERSMVRRLERLGGLLLDLLPVGWSCLWVAPHDVLYHLPWAALIDRRGRYLIDQGPVTLVPGGRLAATLLSSAHQRPASHALLGAGSRTLRQVEPEIRRLQSVVVAPTSRLEATRDDLLQALASHDAVHLAGHAVYLDEAPGASGLRLEDGFLTIHDLAVAEIRARLVSFGVCSGVRLQQAEAARFEGFLRALLAAGVRNVIGPTGWVRDESAHGFALAFFASLGQTGHPAAAFREALLALRQDDPHPASWGFYQIFGDARPWSE